MFVSVIIPTYNRCELLRNAIVSLQRLNYPEDLYEIIVIDNNSTDDTRHVVEGCKKQGKKEIKYFNEMREGLLNARHAGAKIAEGEILAYIDNDVVCDPDWLSELTKPYIDSKVGCVGGKILPRFETGEPEWARWFSGFLSILDRGSETKKVNDAGIWGCNFSVRKSVLYQVGGFNPDATPWNLIKYWGDGETGLLYKVIEEGYDVVYTPFAFLTHIIPQERVTLDYFKKRAFLHGIEASYTEIRKNGGMVASRKRRDLLNSAICRFTKYTAYCKAVIKAGFRYAYYYDIAYKCREKGTLYHRAAVLKDPSLLKFILREDYLDEELGC